MKKIIFISFLFFIFCNLSSQNLTLGPKIGLNVGSPLPIGEKIPKGAKGLPLLCHNLGVFFNYKFNEDFSFQTEVIFSRKGAEFVTPIDSMPYSDRIEVIPGVWADVETFFKGFAEGAFDNYYLEIPAILIYNFGQSKWSLMGGGYYGWLSNTETHAVAIGKAGYDPTLKKEVLDFAENTRTYDYGLLMGTSYKANKHISVNLRITYGLKSVFVDNYSKIDYKLHNMFAEFSANYSFNTEKWF